MTDKEQSDSLVAYLEEKKKIRDKIRVLTNEANEIKHLIDQDNTTEAIDRLKVIAKSISEKEHDYLVLTRKEISLKNNISKGEKHYGGNKAICR